MVERPRRYKKRLTKSEILARSDADEQLVIPVTPHALGEIEKLRREGSSLGKSVGVYMLKEILRQKRDEAEKEPMLLLIKNPFLQEVAYKVALGNLIISKRSKYLYPTYPIESFIQAEEALRNNYRTASKLIAKSEEIKENKAFEIAVYLLGLDLKKIYREEYNTSDIDKAVAQGDADAIIEAERYKDILIKTGSPILFMDNYLDLEREKRTSPDDHKFLTAVVNSVNIFKNLYHAAGSEK